MKGYLFVMVVLVVSANAEANISRKEKRCQIEDKLNVQEALVRNRWARRCEHITRKQYDDNVFNDAGEYKSKPQYDSYHKPYDFYHWFKTPISEYGDCSLGADNNYTESISCTAIVTAEIPIDQIQRCEEFRLNSFVTGKITAYDYEFLKETSQVPLFSRRTEQLIGYYSCSDY
ncbi:hypothetical protein [Pseudoalteromonas sp. S558]|jgi:hypothetical protein|uniref:hypothetical protein n=1 Tax=Pseudoalteromonas sp. S558 TaxID=2066515 RepID=UPI00110BF96E|nr:hypothetical protein [Pseudoalteromonas sp. S558]TMO04005.1 hypothetical protein CWB66_09425 [Pseudoalteromonas sp. S558]